MRHRYEGDGGILGIANAPANSRARKLAEDAANAAAVVRTPGGAVAVSPGSALGTHASTGGSPSAFGAGEHGFSRALKGMDKDELCSELERLRRYTYRLQRKLEDARRAATQS